MYENGETVIRPTGEDGSWTFSANLGPSKKTVFTRDVHSARVPTFHCSLMAAVSERQIEGFERPQRFLARGGLQENRRKSISHPFGIKWVVFTPFAVTFVARLPPPRHTPCRKSICSSRYFFRNRILPYAKRQESCSNLIFSTTLTRSVSEDTRLLVITIIRSCSCHRNTLGGLGS